MKELKVKMKTLLGKEVKREIDSKGVSENITMEEYEKFCELVNLYDNIFKDLKINI